MNLEDSFQCHVDLITAGVEDEEFLEQIRGDEVILYGTKINESWIRAWRLAMKYF